MLWKLTLKCACGRVLHVPAVAESVEVEVRNGELMCFNRWPGGDRVRVLWMQSARPTAWDANLNRVTLIGVEYYDGARYLQEVNLEPLPSSEEHAPGRSNS